jgi:hypothetical protein
MPGIVRMGRYSWNGQGSSCPYQPVTQRQIRLKSPSVALLVEMQAGSDLVVKKHWAERVVAHAFAVEEG